ncbi:MAG: GDSL-type esterase/lipase family protein [Capsulimonas sp.]|uniref:GDSL-type esterase/lipase family protein n=1 Tax=Capsulimonas sp. TaxID=2494211 RepID=UPI0032668267
MAIHVSKISGLGGALAAKTNVTDRVADPGAVINRPVVATRCSSYSAGLSDGVVTGGTYRVQHNATRTAADLQVVYGNFYNIDVDGPNDITISSAAIETPSGTFYPLFFGGQRSATIKPGGLLVSDPVGVDIASGAAFYTRTYVTVASAGQKWPLGLTTQTTNGEGNNASAAPSDLSTSGTVPTAFAFAYHPLAIVGACSPRNQATLALIGDSIFRGQADTPNDNGYIIRAINKTVGHINLSMAGEQALNFQGTTRARRIRLARGCSHALVQLGVNDMGNGRTLVQIQADLLNIWNALSLRGCKVYQCTITPSTNSSDSYATTVNQTPKSAAFGPGVCIRTQLNDWIRTVPAPLSGCIEVADAVESARNSGLWLPNYTNAGDGTHPNVAACTTIASAISAQVQSLSV